jgi:hypothetical protein
MVPRCRTMRGSRLHGEIREDAMQYEEFERDVAVQFEGHVASIQSRLEATPHLWGLIGIVYAYLALFAVAIVLTVAHP